jgi:tungstate transport system substrate-binding protein
MHATEDSVQPWTLPNEGATYGVPARVRRQTYTVTDRGAYLKRRKHLDLVILSEGDPVLLNRYSVIVANPEKHPHVRHAEAERFLTFRQSPATRKFIAEFGIERYGEPLFLVNPLRPGVAGQ